MSSGSRSGAGALATGPSAPKPSLLQRRRLRLYEPIQRRTYLSLAVLSLCLVFGLWAALSYTGAVQNLFLPTPDPGLAGGRDRVVDRHPVARYRRQRAQDRPRFPHQFGWWRYRWAC